MPQRWQSFKQRRGVGGVVGGMALIFLLAGLATALVGVIGYFVPVLRDVESILPDGGKVASAQPAISEVEIPVPEVVAT